MKKNGFAVGLMAGMAALMVHAMPNPWIECGEDIQCGAEKAGFDFPLQVQNYAVRAMEGMFEFRFFIDEKRQVIVRKVVSFEGKADENGIVDISGDYNEYPVHTTVTLANGVKFSVRGEEDSYKVVNFAAESGYYSIVCDKGLKLKDIEYFYKLLAEAEAPKYSSDDER